MEEHLTRFLDFDEEDDDEDGLAMLFESYQLAAQNQSAKIRYLDRVE